MDLLIALLLALIQGVTEFLPISSAAHLILPALLFGFTDQGLAFDVAVHLGTLAAVLFYFRRRLLDITSGCAEALWRRRGNLESRLAMRLAIATLPVMVAGLLWHDLVAGDLRSVLVIAVASILFALLLAWADWRPGGGKDESEISLQGALVIGLAQALALIPGTSRSGITITAALFLGLSRSAASRFSFLLAIPAIFGAALLNLLKMSTDLTAVKWSALLLGGAFAALSAFLGIHFFLRLIERIGMLPFVAYRIALGILLLPFAL